MFVLLELMVNLTNIAYFAWIVVILNVFIYPKSQSSTDFAGPSMNLTYTYVHAFTKNPFFKHRQCD